jgi:hypothetical protein
VVPENFRAYNLAFPSWQAFFEAAYKIYDAEIGYLVHRQWHKLGQNLAPAFIKMYTDPAKSLDDIEEMLEDPEIQVFTEEMRMPLPIILAGQTPNDLEYQEKVLDEILAETGGHKVTAMSEPDMEGFTMLYLLRLGHKNLNFVYAGGYFGSWHQYGTPDFNIRYAPLAEEVLRKHQATGLLVQSGGDAMMGPLARTGGGGTTSLEQFIAWDVCEKESIEGAWEYFVDAATVAKEHGIPPGFDAMVASQRMTREQRQTLLASQPDTRRLQWQWKIKQMLDPNDTGELEGYQTVKPVK